MTPLEIEAEDLLARGFDISNRLIAGHFRFDDVHPHAERDYAQEQVIASMDVLLRQLHEATF